MSQEKKTWLGRVFASIAALFMNNYESWLKKLWNNIAEELKPDLIVVVDLMEKVKTITDSPLVDMAVLIIPGDKDDKAVAWFRKTWDSIISELRLKVGATSSDLTKSDKQTIATRLTEEITGLPFDQASTTIKTAYWNTIKLVG